MSKLHVSLIIEILGRPAEHVKESLNMLVVKLGSEKGVRIIDKTYHEPAPVEDSKDLFTAFAEVDAELDSLGNYFGILFAYMPSNIEIISPEKLTLTNFDLNDVGHTLVQRLHNYDAIVKKISFERTILLEKIKELSPETYKELTSPPDKKTISQSNKKSR